MAMDGERAERWQWLSSDECKGALQVTGLGGALNRNSAERLSPFNSTLLDLAHHHARPGPYRVKGRPEDPHEEKQNRLSISLHTYR